MVFRDRATAMHFDRAGEKRRHAASPLCFPVSGPTETALEKEACIPFGSLQVTRVRTSGVMSDRTRSRITSSVTLRTAGSVADIASSDGVNFGLSSSDPTSKSRSESDGGSLPADFRSSQEVYKTGRSPESLRRIEMMRRLRFRKSRAYPVSGCPFTKAPGTPVWRPGAAD